MRTLTTLLLLAFTTLACHDARVSTDRRTEEEKQKTQQAHQKEMKEATDTYRSMKISDMASQKQDDKKASQSAEEPKDSKPEKSPNDQKRQP